MYKLSTYGVENRTNLKPQTWKVLSWKYIYFTVWPGLWPLIFKSLQRLNDATYEFLISSTRSVHFPTWDILPGRMRIILLRNLITINPLFLIVLRCIGSSKTQMRGKWPTWTPHSFWYLTSLVPISVENNKFKKYLAYNTPNF